MSKWRIALRGVFANGIPRRSFFAAIVVGSILNLISQGDALLSFDHVNWLKIVLTYCVPYIVCTYGAVSATMLPSPQPHLS